MTDWRFIDHKNTHNLKLKSFSANYVEHLLFKKKPIVFIMPNNLFTYFSKNNYTGDMATLTEFDQLAKSLSRHPDADFWVVVEND